MIEPTVNDNYQHFEGGEKETEYEAYLAKLNSGIIKKPELSREERLLLEKLFHIKDIRAYLREEFKKYPIPELRETDI